MKSRHVPIRSSSSNLTHDALVGRLTEHDIRPSAQRVAVARFVLQTREHPSADRVLSGVQPDFPMISRATVYNTLRLFVERGLLREVKVGTSSIVYDANTERHHHLIDDETGEIHDIPWDAVDVEGAEALEGFEVRNYRVVFQGRRLSDSATEGSPTSPPPEETETT